MKLYRKDGDVLEIIAFPSERVMKGDYLLIEDDETDIHLITQVIDISYIDTPGILEELIREGLIRSSSIISRNELDYDRATKFIRDTKVLKCIIRGAIKNGEIVRFIDDLPSRVTSKIRRMSAMELLKVVGGESRYPIRLGNDLMNSEVALDISYLDGSLSLITGMKGSGKSHLAKLIAYSFSEHSIPYIVFDINDEYLGLEESGYAKVLVPGESLYFDLQYLGRETVLDVLINVLNLPGVSANLFNEIWQMLERRNVPITISSMMEYIDKFIRNMMIKDALISRLMILRSCKFIHDSGYIDIKNFFSNIKGYVISLRNLSSVERKILVEILLKKLSLLLEKNTLPPFFLFAEEAHIYVRDTFWEDVITRMRHFGLFIIFITNQPDTLDHLIFRQLDNIFIFRFLNDKDLESLSRVSNVDSITIKSIVKDLRKGQVLVIGNIVGLFPIVASVRELEFDARGRTKRVLDYITLSHLD